MSFGGGSGSSSLSTSTDVVLNSPANNQVLGYNSALAKWQNQTASGGATADASLLTSGTLADARLPVTAQAATLSSTYALVGAVAPLTVLAVRKDPTTGFWPTAYATDGTPSYASGSTSTGVRPTARDDITIIWKGAAPFPPTVSSPSTAGVRDNVDLKFEEPA